MLILTPLLNAMFPMMHGLAKDLIKNNVKYEILDCY